MKTEKHGIGKRELLYKVWRKRSIWSLLRRPSKLLYKVWRKRYKGFLDIDLRISLTDGNGIEAEYDLNDVVFCQYTGLKDKKGTGNKIFHKDIFKHKNGYVGVVEWVKDGWFVVFSDYEIRLSKYLEVDGDRVVVGNCFENPNLLNN